MENLFGQKSALALYGHFEFLNMKYYIGNTFWKNSFIVESICRNISQVIHFKNISNQNIY